MENPRKLPCGCCAHGCCCREHAADRKEAVCDYHAIADKLIDQMRDVFADDVRRERAP